MQSEYFIEQLRATLSVTRSGYHAWSGRRPGHARRPMSALWPLIEQAHQESRQTYGSPRVHRWLRQRGHTCGRHRIARLMRAASLRSQARRRFRPMSLTDSHYDLPIAPNRERLHSALGFKNPLWTLKPTSTKYTHAACTHSLVHTFGARPWWFVTDKCWFVTNLRLLINYFRWLLGDFGRGVSNLRPSVGEIRPFLIHLRLRVRDYHFSRTNRRRSVRHKIWLRKKNGKVSCKSGTEIFVRALEIFQLHRKLAARKPLTADFQTVADGFPNQTRMGKEKYENDPCVTGLRGETGRGAG
jgi:HTH-like domain